MQEPYFNETGSNCPSTLPRSQQMELLDLAVRAVQCMGFVLGVFHTELKYTSRGPRLIEVNARMGGGPVRNTNLLVWGVDLVEQHVTACCGIPCRPGIAQKPLKELAELTINATVRGHSCAACLRCDSVMWRAEGKVCSACTNINKQTWMRALCRSFSCCMSVS